MENHMRKLLEGLTVAAERIADSLEHIQGAMCEDTTKGDEIEDVDDETLITCSGTCGRSFYAAKEAFARLPNDDLMCIPCANQKQLKVLKKP